MVIVELYAKCLQTKYKNYLISKASIFIAICTLLNIAIPFIFAYNSRGFWLKHDTFYEQPDVKFKGEYLFIAYTNNIRVNFICNNFAFTNEEDFEDNCTQLKAIEVDNNLDGKADSFRFELNLNLPEHIKITKFDLLLTLDYKLKATCRLHMQSLILLQEMVLDSSQIRVSSVLKLSQLYPIYCNPKIINVDYNASIIDNNVDTIKFESIIERYYQRNVTTYLLPMHKIQKRNTEVFSLQLDVIYPEHMFYYTTTFWQIIKWAWIQYLSIYLVLWWIIKKIKGYVFDNCIVVFYEESALKCKQD